MELRLIRSNFTRVVRLGLAIVTFVTLQACGPNGDSDSRTTTAAANAEENKRFYEFTENGELLQPENYREWIYVGTPLTPNSQNSPEANFPEFHAVYIDPVSWDIYRKTGKFRNGTIIVKELIAIGERHAASGNGYFMGEYYGLEATVKDTERFPDQPGGWVYYTWGHGYPLTKTSAAFPAAACNKCHEVNAADDFVFTQYYPVLGGRETAASTNGWTHDQLLEKIEEDKANRYDDFRKADAGMTKEAAAPVTTTSEVPIETAALFKFLQDGEYKKFATFDKGTHPSAGPHFNYGDAVQVWFNDRAANALRAGTELPEGAALVKEITPKGNDALGGWAVSVKTQKNADGGKGWFWAEFTSTTDSTKHPVDPGNGVQLCTGCHSGGHDFTLSDLPEM